MSLWIALSAIFLIHFSFIVWTFRGLKKLSLQKSSSNQNLRSYSIIIAAHNEADNIANCLNSLVNQNYPKDQYEIIVAADRCEDNTVEVVNKFRPEFNHLHVIEVWNPPTGVSPKKFAINQALQHAQYEYFLFLDADVVPTKNHIRTMNQYFEKQIAAVISLMKFYPPKSFWQNFLVYEKLVSWCIAGAGVGFNRPIISYGGNWGYTKSAFNKVSGFENIRFSLSGDDDLLLQQMGKMKLPISFCLAREGWIRMEPPKSLSQFIRQRRRHFSAGKTYRFYLQGGYFLYHATNLALWLAWIFYLPAILLLIVKLAGDIMVLKQGEKLFKENFNLLLIIVYNLLYMLYNTLIGPFGYIGKIRW